VLNDGIIINKGKIIERACNDKIKVKWIFWNRTNNNKRMICGKLENKLEPKDSFRDHIANYFTELAGNSIDLLYELIDKITNTQYDNYKGSGINIQNQENDIQNLNLRI
jgi:hypothetical protein